MTMAAISQFETDLAALGASVDRAGRALGCNYATAGEFEAAFVSAHRRQGAFTRHVLPARMMLGVTAVTSLAALLLLAL